MAWSPQLPQPRALAGLVLGAQGLGSRGTLSDRKGWESPEMLEAPGAAVPVGATTPRVSLMGLLMPGAWASEGRPGLWV